MISWITLFIVIGFSVFSAISGIRIAASKMENKRSYYIHSLRTDLLLLLLLLGLAFYINATNSLDFDDGIGVPDFLRDIGIFLFMFPFIFSLTPLYKQYFRITGNDE